MGLLHGKVAIVTGASRGIGKGVALVLAKEGATVYVTGRTVANGTSPLPGTICETASECDRLGATVLPANWKLAMEAFMEGYHVMTTHPQLQHAQPMLYDGIYVHQRGPFPQMADDTLSHRENQELQVHSMAVLSEGMAGMIHQKEVDIARSLIGIEEGLPEDRNQAVLVWLGMVMQQITERLRARGEPVPDLCAASQLARDTLEYIFPPLAYMTQFNADR